MIKIVQWPEKQIKTKLEKRLEDAKYYRQRCAEIKWRENEITVFEPGGLHQDESSNTGFADIDIALQEAFNTDENVPNVNYVYRHVKFLHSQLIANPPMVQPRPNSSDVSDKRSAECADAAIHYGLRQYKMKQKFERSCLDLFVYGLGWIATEWDATKGGIVSFDEDKGAMKVEGDFHARSINPWDIWVQPSKEAWEDVDWVFERKWYNEEELEFYFKPKAVALITKKGETRHQASNNNRPYADRFRLGNQFQEKEYAVYWYWEKGTPLNAYLGRHVACLGDGTPLTEMGTNPHRFIPSEVREQALNKEIEEAEIYYKARLPFHPLLGDIVSGQFYPNTFVSYEKASQDMINKLDHLTMENIEANGALVLAVSEGSGVNETDVNDGGPWQVQRVSSMNEKPSFITPGGQMPDIQSFREKLKGAGEDMAALNESMFGQQSRETSAMAMEYAVNQGNLVRRNIFDHYTTQTESVWNDYLDIVRTHWTTPKTVRVIGKEKAFDTYSISGANIAGGFDIVVEYGTSAFLDPVLRKQNFIQNFQLYQQAGVDMKVLLDAVELGDEESVHDYIKSWERRQSEIFQIMVAENIYIKPEEMQDHQAMVSYGYKYFATAEFRDLEDKHKKLLHQHIKEREGLAKATMAGSPGGALNQQTASSPANTGAGAAAPPAPPQGPGLGQ